MIASLLAANDQWLKVLQCDQCDRLGPFAMTSTEDAHRVATAEGWVGSLCPECWKQVTA